MENKKGIKQEQNTQNEMNKLLLGVQKRDLRQWSADVGY